MSQDIRVVVGCGEVAQVNSLGMERIGQHGFPCGLWHPPPRKLQAGVLRRPLAGPVDQAIQGGVCPGQVSQLPELRVGPALPPMALGGAVALGGGVGAGISGGVMGTGGGGWPGGVLVVVAVGSPGERGRRRTWTPGYARTVSASG